MGFAAISLGALPAQAQLSVDEIAIAAALAGDATGSGWFFLVEVQGTGLSSGLVTPPVGDAFALTDARGEGRELEFEAGPFGSFAALQSAHPAGDYTVTVNGSHTVVLAWSPTEPVGVSGEASLVIDSPADGATGVDAMPDVSYTLDCMNCDDLNLELQSLPGPTFGFGELDVGMFTNPIPFAAMMSSGSETELAPGLVDAELLAGLVSFTDRSFLPPSGLPAFTYIEAGVVTTFSTFTVPEPGGVGTALAALATLGLLGRHKRRGTPVQRRV
jgi:hypothetical protein